MPLQPVAVCKAALGWSRKAREAGWRSRIDTAARDGHTSVLVRMAGPDGNRAVAQYVDGKARSAYVWQAQVRGSLQRVSFRKLGEHVQEGL